MSYIFLHRSSLIHPAYDAILRQNLKTLIMSFWHISYWLFALFFSFDGWVLFNLFIGNNFKSKEYKHLLQKCSAMTAVKNIIKPIIYLNV